MKKYTLVYNNRFGCSIFIINSEQNIIDAIIDLDDAKESTIKLISILEIPFENDRNETLDIERVMDEIDF